MKRVILAAAVAALSFVGFAQEDFTSYAHKAYVTFNYTGETPLENFTALVKVADGDETVCDLRPCVDGDGVAGLYDTVSRKILYSMGTDAFAASETEVWAFYDDMWRTWSTTYNPDDFPIAGTIKPEYDVAGCVASCMMLGHIQQIGKDDEKLESDKTILVTAEAKPLGTVEDLDGGGRAPVTAYNRFIAASRPYEKIFTEAQLVLVGSVPRSPGCSMEPGWYEHVKKHSPKHQTPGCGYCKLWAEWSQPSFKASIRSWLRANSESCRAKGGGGPPQKGGYPYAH